MLVQSAFGKVLPFKYRVELYKEEVYGLVLLDTNTIWSFVTGATVFAMLFLSGKDNLKENTYLEPFIYSMGRKGKEY